MATVMVMFDRDNAVSSAALLGNLGVPHGGIEVAIVAQFDLQSHIS